MNNKRYIQIDDLLKIKRPTELSVSPDGQWLAYTLIGIDAAQDRYESNIWLVPSQGGPARQFTRETTDSQPRFSPDGQWLAFCSARSGKSQIYLIPVHGGEARALTDLQGSFSGLEWSPDSRTLAFIFRRDDPEEQQKRPRRITRLDFKEQGSDLAPEDYFHLWTVSVESGETKQLTSGSYHHTGIAWSPDGTQIATACNRHPDAALDPDNTDIWLVPRQGGPARQLTQGWSVVLYPRWSPDGQHLIYLGHRQPECNLFSRNFHVWQVDLNGQAVDLMPDFDRTCLNLALSDMRSYGEDATLQFSPDGKYIYILVSDNGSTQIYMLERATGTLRPLTQGRHEIGHFVLGPDYLALIKADPSQPGEVFRLDLPAVAAPVALTSHNTAMLSQLKLTPPADLQVPGEYGPAQGWIYYPPDFDKHRQYPLILQIHGGPYSFYADNFFHEMHWLAACGYVVVCLNPPGSQSYGEAYAKALNTRWTTIDYPYQMKAVDMLIAEGYIDAQRLGVSGGSYGGLMTNLIIARTDRFAAAVTQRSLVDFISFLATSDAGIYFRWELGGFPWEQFETYWKLSPLAHVAKIRTPLLIIHSTHDLRTPINQAEELFVALKILGREVELLRFPGETHDLSRSGKPKHRQERLQAIRAWFDRYLQPTKEAKV